MTEGASDREVAQRLYISAHTVNSHLRHVFAKLGIRSRVELARLAGERQAADSITDPGHPLAAQRQLSRAAINHLIKSCAARGPGAGLSGMPQVTVG